MISEFAKYLNNPFVLIGFTFLIFSTILKSVIKKLRSPNQKESTKLLNKIVNFALVASILIIAISTIYFFGKNQKSNINDIYLSLWNKNELEYEYSEDNNLEYPIETVNYKIDSNTKLSFNDLVEWRRYTETTQTTFPLYIFNKKSTGELDKFWIKIFVPEDIGSFAIGPEYINSTNDPSKKMNEYYIEFGGGDFSDDLIMETYIIFSFNIQPLERTIELPYVIGTSNEGFIERKLRINVVLPKGVSQDITTNTKGLKLMYESNYEEAIKCFEAAIRINPSIPEYYYNLANANYLVGNYCIAEKALEKAVNIGVKSEEGFFLANLSSNMALCSDEKNKTKLKKALNLIIRAIEINKKNKSYDYHHKEVDEKIFNSIKQKLKK